MTGRILGKLMVIALSAYVAYGFGDLFLDEWFSVVPEDRLAEVREAVRQVIDRESEGAYFDVSAKALVISGVK